MKVILLHGNDSDKLQKRLGKFIDSAIKRGWHLERLSDSPEFIEQTLKGVSLFGQENLFLLQNPQKVSKTTLNFIKENNTSLEGTLVVYSEGTIPKNTLTKLPKATSEEKYELPVLIWKFLDSFYPGNSKECLNLFHKLVPEEAPEKILALLSSYFRDVAIAKRDKKALNYPSWREERLSKTAEKFVGNSLEKITKSLAVADMSSKSGKGSLSELLDLIILTRLE